MRSKSYRSIFSFAFVPFEYIVAVFYTFVRKLSERERAQISARRTENCLIHIWRGWIKLFPASMWSAEQGMVSWWSIFCAHGVGRMSVLTSVELKHWNFDLWAYTCCYYHGLTWNTDLFNFSSIEWKGKGISDFFFFSWAPYWSLLRRNCCHIWYLCEDMVLTILNIVLNIYVKMLIVGSILLNETLL